MTDTQQTNAALIAEAHEIAGQLRERASGEFSSNHEWYLSIAHTLSGLITALEASEAKLSALTAPTVTKERISRLIQINLGTVKSHADDLAESILAALQVSHD